MKVTIQKLGITIEDEEVCGKELRSTAVGTQLDHCTKGYAVYAFGGTRNLRRVGGATCLFPFPGSTASSAGSHLLITSAMSNQLSTIGSHGTIKELRLAVCCPPPAGGISLAKAGSA